MRTAVLLLTAAVLGAPLEAQGVPVRDLLLGDDAVPVRLVGYGIVTGLAGTGDLTFTGRNAAHTVQSVANLLRRFDISVPPEMLRTRNVAAVLVTAEVTPWLRAGGRVDVQVASVGDARSLRGGVLWMTPLVAEAGGRPFATAQGPLVVEDVATVAGTRRRYASVEGSGRIPGGAIMQAELPHPSATTNSAKLLLREPDVRTAARIAAVIDSAIGPGTAKVDDPGAISLTLKDSAGTATLAKIHDLRVDPVRTGRILIDARLGTVVAGGELLVGPAVVSVGGITLAIGRAAADTTPGADRSAVRLPTGATVQQIAVALQAVRLPPHQMAQVLDALRQVGALSAEIVTR